jgi:hypothetical protein
MANIMYVSPTKEVDAENKVAIWDQSHEHMEFDPRWAAIKCLWIEGSSDNPGQVYPVADTDFVRERIKRGFLKEVDAPVVATKAVKADK